MTRSQGAPGEAGDPVSTGLGFALLLVAAVAVRSWAASRTHVIFNDGPIFLAMAEAIADGRWDAVLAHPFHPLYPLMIVASKSLFGLEVERAALVVSIAGGAMAVLGATLAARRAFDPVVGWLVGVTVAFHPWAIDFSSDVLSDGLYAGFYLMGFAALVPLVERPTPGRALACGAWSGAAYLVRPEGVGLALVALVLVVGRGALDRSARRRALVAALAVAVAAAALMAPLTIALSADRGELTLTRKKSVSALVQGESGVQVSPAVEGARGSGAPESPPPIPLPRSSQRIDDPGEVRPTRNLFGAFEALSRAWRTALATFRYEVAFFACVGIWGLRRRFDSVREATFGLSALAYTAVLVLLVWGAGYVARRHALAPVLPLAAYAAVGWRMLHGAVVDRLVPGASWARRGLAVVLGLVLALGVVWGARDLRERRSDRAPVRRAAEWLADHAGEGRVVAAQKLRVSYYARGRFVPLPTGRGGPIRDALRAQGTEWIVIDEARLPQHRGLASGVGVWLRVAHEELGSGRRALVLELR